MIGCATPTLDVSLAISTTKNPPMTIPDPSKP
jgi:hypothetical protein